MNGNGEGPDLSYCRAYYLRGDCPCCGSPLVSWPGSDREYEPEAVAEGVMMCGRCIGSHHYEPPGFLADLLRSLTPRMIVVPWEPAPRKTRGE